MKRSMSFTVIATMSLSSLWAQAQTAGPTIWPAPGNDPLVSYLERSLFTDGKKPKGIAAVLANGMDLAVVRVGQVDGPVGGPTYVLDFANQMAYYVPAWQTVESAAVCSDGHTFAAVLSAPWSHALVIYDLSTGNTRRLADVQATVGSLRWLDTRRIEYLPWSDGRQAAQPVVLDLDTAADAPEQVQTPDREVNVNTCGGVTSCGNNIYPCCGNGGNCTWWAWNMMCTHWGKTPGNFGNACNWLNAASAAGYYTSSTPATSTVCVRSAVCLGHCAWVTSFDANRVYVTEMNCDYGPGGMISTSYLRSWFQGYIYKEPPPPPCTGASVTGNPSGLTQCAGTTAQFGASGAGTGPLAYRWQKNGNDLNDDGHFVNVTGTVLGINNINTGDSGSYRCRISNACGTAYTNGANLTVLAPTVINSLFSTSFACEGTTLNFSVSCSGTGTITYQWQKDNVNLANGGHYGGVTTDTLTISSIDATCAGTYRCNVTGGCGSASSQTTTLTVGTSTQINESPSPQAVCTGQSTSFSVAAVGTGINYQWQRNGANITDDEHYSGAAASTLDVNDVKTSLNGNYRCVVSGTCGTQTSLPAALTALPLTIITQQPMDQITCSGTTAVFTTAATGEPPITYQWQKNEVDLEDGGNVSGAQTPTLQISSANTADTADYRCVITAGCGTEITQSAALILWGSTALTRDVEPVIAPAGTRAHFSVAAIGANLSFQWYKDNAPLSDDADFAGTAAPVLTILHASLADEGQYACRVSGPCGTVWSSTAGLTLGVGTLADIGPTYLLGPRDVNGGGGYATTADYTAWSSSAQHGGVDDITSSDYLFHDGFWPTVFAPVPVVIVPGDFDHDGDVDGFDVQHMAGCFTGDELGPPAAGCADTDLDGDNDCDQSDFALLQLCLSGFNVPADPACSP